MRYFLPAERGTRDSAKKGVQGACPLSAQKIDFFKIYPMQFKIFQIGISGDTAAEDDLNKFLRSHRIITVHRELTRTQTGTYWCFCIEYIEANPVAGTAVSLPARKGKVDYKEVLSEDDFAVYSKLRDIRKNLSQQEAVPVYAVCENVHLAAMVQDKCQSLSDMQKIPGFGEAKVTKYGQHFLECLNTSLRAD